MGYEKMCEDVVVACLTVPSVQCKERVKCTLVKTLRLCTGRTAHRWSRGIALLFLDNGTKRGEGSASRPGVLMYRKF